jgi:hypothetical protein
MIEPLGLGDRARWRETRDPSGSTPRHATGSAASVNRLGATAARAASSDSRIRTGDPRLPSRPFQTLVAMPSPGRAAEGGLFLSRSTVAHTRRATARSYWARSRSPFASALSAWRSANRALTARTAAARPRAACARSRAACARSLGPDSQFTEDPHTIPSSARSGRLSRVTACDGLLPTRRAESSARLRTSDDRGPSPRGGTDGTPGAPRQQARR